MFDDTILAHDADTLASGSSRSAARRAALGLDASARIGRHIVIEPLGAGGMGAVYAAFDPQLDRRVAVKLILPGRESEEARVRLIREAQAMARLSHANVVAVHDAGVHEGSVFIVMDLVEGQTLSSWLSAENHGWREIVEIFVAAGRGLAAAHDAGVIHRDFKPDNVLVGSDGAVKVTDFGLACAIDSARVGGGGERSQDDAPRELEGRALDTSSSALRASITPDGEVMGTPFYMSPEQFLSKTTAAATDQFSFCVALYEGLYDESPFDGETIPARLGRMLEHDVKPAPGGSVVPRRIRAALLRGLAPIPEERWPSMSALLEALSYDPSRARRRRLRAGAVAVAFVLAGGGLWAYEQRARARCRELGAGADQVWDQAARARVRRSILDWSRRLPHAEQSWVGASTRIDAWARAWSEARAQACLAERGGGALASSRSTCLDKQVYWLRSLVRLLASGSRESVNAAVASAAGLPPPARCDDPLVSQRAGDLDASVVDFLDEQLAEIQSLDGANKLDQALEVSAALLDALDREASPRAYCEAQLVAGVLHDRRGETASAERALRDAYFSAGRLGSDELALEAAIALVAVVGVSGARHDEAGEWLEHAKMLLDRTRGRGRLAEAELAYNAARLQTERGLFKGALREFERALELERELLGPGHPRAARILDNLGDALFLLSDYDAAQARYEEALALRVRVFGRDHPEVANSLSDLGLLFEVRGQSARAVEQFERALELNERAYSEDHPNVTDVLSNLGNAYYSAGDYAKAVSHQRRALELTTKINGAEHPQVAKVLNNLGNALNELGAVDEAISHLRRALEIKAAQLGPTHPVVGNSHNSLGHALYTSGAYKEALTRFEEALMIGEQALGEQHRWLAHPLTGVGKSLVELERAADAIPKLERALRLRAVADADLGEAGDTRLALARALWAEGSDRARARRLADHAVRDFHAAGDAWRKELALAEAWIAEVDVDAPQP